MRLLHKFPGLLKLYPAISELLFLGLQGNHFPLTSVEARLRGIDVRFTVYLPLQDKCGSPTLTEGHGLSNPQALA
jgi:hypothetical protein